MNKLSKNVDPDKMMGHHNKNKSDSKLYKESQKTEKEIRKDIINYLREFNDIENKKKMTKKKNKDFNKKYFFNHSSLNWEDKSKGFDNMFKLKFLTLILIQLYINLHKIIEKIIIKYPAEKRFKKRNKLVTSMRSVINGLVLNLINNKPCSNYLLKVNEYLGYIDLSSKKEKKKFKDKNELIYLLSSDLKTGFIEKFGKPAYYSKDNKNEGLSLLLKLTSLLCCEEENKKFGKKIKEIIESKNSNKEDIKKLITLLGSWIKESENPLMFQMFTNITRIKCGYLNEIKSNTNFGFGLFAIAYTNFILGNIHINKVINNILNNK